MALRYKPPLRAVVGIAAETTCVDSNAPAVAKFVGMSNVDGIRPGRRRNVVLCASAGQGGTTAGWQRCGSRFFLGAKAYRLCSQPVKLSPVGRERASRMGAAPPLTFG